MRTTIRIDDDVLLAAKELARRDGISVGAVISALARKGLSGVTREERLEDDSFFGFRQLPKRGQPVSNEWINRLRGDGPY